MLGREATTPLLRDYSRNSLAIWMLDHLRVCWLPLPTKAEAASAEIAAIAELDPLLNVWGVRESGREEDWGVARFTARTRTLNSIATTWFSIALALHEHPEPLMQADATHGFAAVGVAQIGRNRWTPGAVRVIQEGEMDAAGEEETVLIAPEFGAVPESALAAIPDVWYSPAWCDCYGDPPSREELIDSFSEFEQRLLVARSLLRQFSLEDAGM